MTESGSNLVRNLAKRISRVTASLYSITKYARDLDTQEARFLLIFGLSERPCVRRFSWHCGKIATTRCSLSVLGMSLFAFIFGHYVNDITTSVEITWFADTRTEEIESNE